MLTGWTDSTRRVRLDGLDSGWQETQLARLGNLSVCLQRSRITASMSVLLYFNPSLPQDMRTDAKSELSHNIVDEHFDDID